MSGTRSDGIVPIVLCIVAVLAAWLAGWKHGAEFHKMTPVVDPATGCQYLITGARGITPRLNSDGNHICSDAEVH